MQIFHASNLVLGQEIQSIHPSFPSSGSLKESVYAVVSLFNQQQQEGMPFFWSLKGLDSVENNEASKDVSFCLQSHLWQSKKTYTIRYDHISCQLTKRKRGVQEKTRQWENNARNMYTWDKDGWRHTIVSKTRRESLQLRRLYSSSPTDGED
jgi:hypothetical protein